MNIAICKNLFLIKNLRVLEQEIPKEGSEQLAMMLKRFLDDIPDYIKAIERLNKLEAKEHGKGNTGTNKETVTTPDQLHESRHQAMRLWTVPD